MATATSSVKASDRIMRDLQFVYNSDAFKNGIYDVNLINDSLYEWKVDILQIDTDSQLHSDLLRLQASGKKANIELHIKFTDRYPFDPPFVHVVRPILFGGYIFGGGAICLELLTKDGWSSIYTVESLLMQIIATLCKGRTRVNFSSTAECYTYSQAVQTFESIKNVHRLGWSSNSSS